MTNETVGTECIDKDELAQLEAWALRERIRDNQHKRDAQRRMAWFSLLGMLGFPFGVILCSYLSLDKASELLSAMSSIYYVSIAAIVAAYFGFSNLGGKQNVS